MTPTELRHALTVLGWSQGRAARELQVSPRQFRYWAAGAQPVPNVVSIALKSLLKEQQT
jgi:hypothetical protein